MIILYILEYLIEEKLVNLFDVIIYLLFLMSWERIYIYLRFSSIFCLLVPLAFFHGLCTVILYFDRGSLCNP
jgi:hypothetical protein